MKMLIDYALTNAAMATLLALVVWGVTRVVRRPAVRNALWLLVLARLLFPPLWGVPMPVGTAVREVPVIEQEVEKISGNGEELSSNELLLALALLDDAVDLDSLPGPRSEDLAVQEAHPVESQSIASAGNIEAVATLYWTIGLVWLGGTCWVAIRSMRMIRRFGKLLQVATPPTATDLAMANEIAERLGLSRCPEIKFVPGRVWPSVWAPTPWRRNTKLLIPAGLWPLLDAEQRRAVLAHELSHCRRGDPWVRWFEMVAVALYWWYIPLGWVRRQLRQSEEECCDMRVVAALSGRRAYATALVETAVYLSGPEPAFSSALASGAGPVDDIQRRITMIMSANWPAGLTRLGMAAILGIGTVGLAVGPTLGTAEAQDKEKKDFPKKAIGPKDKRGQEDSRADEPRDREPGPAPREKGPGGEGRGPQDRNRGGRPESESNGPGDEGRGPQGRFPGDRPEGGREEGAGQRDRMNTDEEIRKARAEAEAARAELRKAVDRMVAAETKLAKLQGRPGNMGGAGFGGFGGDAFGGGGGRAGSGGFGPGGPRGQGAEGGGRFGPGGAGGQNSSGEGRFDPFNPVGPRPGAERGPGGSSGGGGGRPGMSGFPGGAGAGGAPGFPGAGAGGASGFPGGAGAGIPGGPGAAMPPGAAGGDVKRNQELERQVDDLRKAVDEMRQMLRDQMRQRQELDRERDRRDAENQEIERRLRKQAEELERLNREKKK